MAVLRRGKIQSIGFESRILLDSIMERETKTCQNKNF